MKTTQSYQYANLSACNNMQRHLDNEMQPFHTCRIITKCAPLNTTKKFFYLCLNEKLEIPSYKGDNLLTKKSKLINKCRHNFTPFYGLIARIKRYVFTEMFLTVFPLKPSFWSARLMFCILRFSEQKSSTSAQYFHWIIL